MGFAAYFRDSEGNHRQLDTANREASATCPRHVQPAFSHRPMMLPSGAPFNRLDPIPTDGCFSPTVDPPIRRLSSARRVVDARHVDGRSPAARNTLGSALDMPPPMYGRDPRACPTPRRARSRTDRAPRSSRASRRCPIRTPAVERPRPVPVVERTSKCTTSTHRRLLTSVNPTSSTLDLIPTQVKAFDSVAPDECRFLDNTIMFGCSVTSGRAAGRGQHRRGADERGQCADLTGNPLQDQIDSMLDSRSAAQPERDRQIQLRLRGEWWTDRSRRDGFNGSV